MDDILSAVQQITKTNHDPCHRLGLIAKKMRNVAKKSHRGDATAASGPGDVR
jgi:hypothetical protein